MGGIVRGAQRDHVDDEGHDGVVYLEDSEYFRVIDTGMNGMECHAKQCNAVQARESMGEQSEAMRGRQWIRVRRAREISS